MKKILVILVLSFFLSENLLADDYIISDNSTSTNDDNTINGNDSLTLNSGITITTSGKIEGIDNCKCGLKGKYFKVLGRAKKAEIRGCSDVYQ